MMDSDGTSWFRGRVIGQGSFGCVFIAKPKSNSSFLPPLMAVKSAEVSASASLQKEKEVFDNLNGCPFVLECFGEEITVGENGEMAYNLLLEYAAGGTLGDLIEKRNGNGLPEKDVRRFTRCILEGICHIHDSGYVHCDLKPDNILLVANQSGKFVAKIADLGVAKRSRHCKRQKFDPSMRGTPLYLSPETVVQHMQEAPSDIWALGCVVLEMLSGRQAWIVKEDCSIDQLFSIIGDEHSLPEIPSRVSKEARDFLRRCFVRKPAFRFTAEMLLDDPFVKGVDEELFRELEGDYSQEGVTLSNADAESCSPECISFIPLEANSSLSSWGSAQRTNEGSTITVKELSSNPTVFCRSFFAIPALAR